MSADNSDALKELQKAKNYWMVNWRMVQKLGSLEEAVILGYLCSMQDYWSKRGKLLEGKWFFCTTDEMRKQTTIEPRKQREAIKRLESYGFIETSLKGKTPKTRHFHVSADKIREHLNFGDSD